LDEWNDRRRTIASFYSSALSGCGLDLPVVPNWANPVWHLYVVQASDRAAVQSHLDGQIQTQIHYPIPPHLQAAYSELAFPRGSFPIAERLSDRVLSLPIGPHLPAEQAKRVIECLLEFCPDKCA
jgi:dTDP-4-amino-4,6-dideoxygalactose transaminase